MSIHGFLTSLRLVKFRKPTTLVFYWKVHTPLFTLCSLPIDNTTHLVGTKYHHGKCSQPTHGNEERWTSVQSVKDRMCTCVSENRVCMPDVGAKLLITLEMIRKVCLSLSQWWQIHWDFFNIGEDIGETTHSHYIVIDTRGRWVVVIYSQEEKSEFPQGSQGGSRLEITCCSHHWKGNQWLGWRRVPPEF